MVGEQQSLYEKDTDDPQIAKIAIIVKKTESKRKISFKPQSKPKRGKGGRKRGGK